MLGRTAAILVRRGFATSARRSGGHGPPTAKDMLPFNPFQNKWVLLAKMGIFAGSAFGLPFYAVYFQLKKKYGS